MDLLAELWRRLWRAAAFATSALTILYYWPDIRDLPAQYGAVWQQLMPDREIVAYFFLAGAILWIAWIDLRPLVLRKTWQKRRVTRVAQRCIDIGEEVYREHKRTEIDNSFFIPHDHQSSAIFERMSIDNLERRRRSDLLIAAQYGLRIENVLSDLRTLGYELPKLPDMHFFIGDIAKYLAGVGYALKDGDTDAAEQRISELKRSLRD